MCAELLAMAENSLRATVPDYHWKASCLSFPQHKPSQSAAVTCHFLPHLLATQELGLGSDGAETHVFVLFATIEGLKSFAGSGVASVHALYMTSDLLKLD